MKNFQEDYQIIKEYMEQSRLRSANEGFDRLLQDYPEHSVLISYQFGVFQRSYIGNGKEARRLFMQAIEFRKPEKESFSLNEVEANASENLMLLSLSFEEYYSWADRLRRFRPLEKEVAEQRTIVEKYHNDGLSWVQVMQGFAAQYYHRDIKQDPGLYPEALSTYHLMLENRRRLSPDRDDYRIAVVGYGAVTKLATAKHGMNMERLCGQTYPNEIDILIENAMPFLEEYVSKNPGDNVVKQSLQDLRNFLPIVKKGGQLSANIPQQKAEGSQQNVSGMGSALPFSFELPNDYEVRQRDAKSFIIKHGDEFQLILRFEKHGQTRHTVPPGYKLLEKRDLKTPSGNVTLLIAKGWIMPFLPRFIISSAIAWPLIYLFFHKQMNFISLGTIGILASLLMTIKQRNPIKYAFVYAGLEYVFTGNFNQRNEIENVMSHLKFI